MMAAALRNVPFPMYGLGQGWLGGRAVRGYAGEGRRGVSTVQLFHGDLDRRESPAVTVETSVRDERRSDDERAADALLRAMLEVVSAETFQSRDDPLNLYDPERQAKVVDAPRGTLRIAVDGRPSDFLVVRDGEKWGAAGRAGEVQLTLWGRSVPIETLKLVRVTDLDPYLATDPLGR